MQHASAKHQQRQLAVLGSHDTGLPRYSLVDDHRKVRNHHRIQLHLAAAAVVRLDNGDPEFAPWMLGDLRRDGQVQPALRQT